MSIAIAGFQHETNTFAAMGAGFADFEEADAWPGLSRGSAILEGFGGMNLPIAGFMAAADGLADLRPLVWCSAEPCSFVAQDAFERISGMICDGLAAAPDLEGVYLDLHGAMVTEAHEDGEGELLRRVRRVVGPEMPLVVSLDLHANVTAAMVEFADAMTIFRTYPHLDMAETGARAWELMARARRGTLGAKAFLKAPFLVPLSAQDTGVEPNRTLYGMLEASAGAGVANIDLAAGFPPADIDAAGPAVVAYGDQAEPVRQAAAQVMAAYEAAEPRFQNQLWSPDGAVRAAMSEDEGRPVVLADVQDNPGAGAASDGTALLRALVAGQAGPAVLAVLHDPEAAVAAHAAGPGGALRLALGAKSAPDKEAPFHGRFRVEALSDGCFACTGEMYAGAETALGPMARLRVLDTEAAVEVIIGSRRFQCLDLAILRHLGVVPEAQRILAVKSTVHFRADFAPIAGRILAVECPGAHPCRLEAVPYRNLRAGLRLGPCGPAFSPGHSDPR